MRTGGESAVRRYDRTWTRSAMRHDRTGVASAMTMAQALAALLHGQRGGALQRYEQHVVELDVRARLIDDQLRT